MMIRIKEIKVKNLSAIQVKKLKVAHRKIFGEKLYFYDDIIYICQSGKSAKYIGMAQIRFKSPEFHFEMEDYNKETKTHNPVPYLIDFGIMIEKRHQGIGTALIKFVINSLDDYNHINLDILNGEKKEKQDEDEPFIDINVDNLVSFYKIFEFEVVGHWYHPSKLKRYLSMTLKLK